MEIPALNDRYKERKLLSQQQMFPKQGSSPEYEKSGDSAKRKRACFSSNQGVDDLYLKFNYLKPRHYLFLFQEAHLKGPVQGSSKLIPVA